MLFFLDRNYVPLVSKTVLFLLNYSTKTPGTCLPKNVPFDSKKQNVPFDSRSDSYVLGDSIFVLSDSILKT